MTFDDILKHTGARGFDTKVSVSTAATGVTQLIAALQTTPREMPMQHKIHVQRLWVLVKTGSAGVTWTIQDGAGSPVLEIPALDMSTAGTVYGPFYFGPNGIPLTANKDLNVSISGAGAAADIYVEGFQEPVTTTNNGIMSFASILPTSGPQAGGTTVVILGAGFRNGAGVTIGGVACTSVRVISSEEIICVTGAHGAGAVNVVVTNPAPNGSETVTGAGAFTYV